MDNYEVLKVLEDISKGYKYGSDEHFALQIAIEEIEKKPVFLDGLKSEFEKHFGVDSLIWGELMDYKEGTISVDDVIKEFNKMALDEILLTIDDCARKVKERDL